MAKKPSTKQNGKISQVIGAVVDVEFDAGCGRAPKHAEEHWQL